VSSDPRLDSREVAELLGVHEVSVRRWRSKNQGPPFERFGRSGRVVRYRLSEVERYRREQTGGGGR
jgi:predicted DNA-binding transcriptional regulator AlpA